MTLHRHSYRSNSPGHGQLQEGQCFVQTLHLQLTVHCSKASANPKLSHASAKHPASIFFKQNNVQRGQGMTGHNQSVQVCDGG